MAETTTSEAQSPPVEGTPRARPVDVVVLGRRQPIGIDSQIMDVLTGLGCDARFVPRDELEPRSDRLLWLRGSATWYQRMLAAVASFPSRDRPPVVLWHSEALPFPRAAGVRQPLLSPRDLALIVRRHDRRVDPYSNFRSLRRVLADDVVSLLCVSMPAGQAFLAEKGIGAELVPFGYHPEHGRDLRLERDIDVLFVGYLGVPRRKRAFRRLRRAGVRLEAVGSLGDARYWGESRTRLLNRAKIMLNVARYPGQLSGKRLILGMANKALVVSEPVYLPGPYQPGRHYVEAPIDELSAVIDQYLGDDEARERIVEAAHALVTRELTLERSVARILRLADEREGLT